MGRPKVRDPHTADLSTWLIIHAHTQLRLARPLAEDLRRPSERSAQPRRLAHPWPGPPGVPPPPREDCLSRRRAQTVQARTWTPTRLEEPQASPRLRAWEDRETNRNPHRTRLPETATRLMIKLNNPAGRIGFNDPNVTASTDDMTDDQDRRLPPEISMSIPSGSHAQSLRPACSKMAKTR